LAVLSPGLGLLLERLVFRPRARRRASAAESLVASLGVLVLTLGMCAGIWGLGARSDTPAVFPNDPVSLFGDTRIGVDTLCALALIVIVCVVLAVVQNRTRFGRQVRAVVDDRQLAELSAIPADRVAAVGWAFGTTLAGFTGVLLAPRLQLSPYGLSLVVLETFAVIVAARLASLPGAVLAGLLIGILQSELTQFSVDGTLGDIYRTLQSNLFVVVLLVLLLAFPKLRELGGDAGSAGRFASRGAPAAGRATMAEKQKDLFAKLAGFGVLLTPLVFPLTELRQAFLVPALGLIFLSIVIVTGYSGQVSLGAAGYAGLGALFALKLEAGEFLGLPEVPGLLAILLGAILVAPVGLITGYPAIRRRGLTLALTTFAVGAVVSRFVFGQTSISGGLYPDPLTFFGLELEESGFYLVELVALGMGLLAVHNLHRGRLGRALLAVRDHTGGAAAVGVDVRNLKLMAFTVSSVVAGLGGALLAYSATAFSADTFAPIQSLLWFTAVIVFGADSAAGAIVAAGFIVAIDVLAPAGSSTLAIGILALALGWLPGGLASAVRGAVRYVAEHIAEQLTDTRPLVRPDRPALAASAGLAAGAPVTDRAAAGQGAGATTGAALAGAGLGAGGGAVAAANLAEIDRVAAARGLVLTPTGRALLGQLSARLAGASAAGPVGGAAQGGTGTPIGLLGPGARGPVVSVSPNHSEGGQR
ncbi:MAG: ABC transporter permease, partial [Frankia sp.]|nr:ABC transporter permease [Frankia sp.]